jgi:hypothetical protein
MSLLKQYGFGSSPKKTCSQKGCSSTDICGCGFCPRHHPSLPTELVLEALREKDFDGRSLVQVTSVLATLCLESVTNGDDSVLKSYLTLLIASAELTSSEGLVRLGEDAEEKLEALFSHPGKEEERERRSIFSEEV